MKHAQAAGFANMPSETICQYDRRSAPRNMINGVTQIKLADNDTYHKALIIDLSQTGILIGTDQPLEKHTQFSLLFESDVDAELPIEIQAKVVRLASSLGDNCFTYGCAISDVTGF